MLQHVSEFHFFLRLNHISLGVYITLLIQLVIYRWRSRIFTKLSDSDPILAGSLLQPLPRNPVQCPLWPPEGTQEPQASVLQAQDGLWEEEEPGAQPFCTRKCTLKICRGEGS